MCEMQEEIERMENEKFEEIADKCPWKKVRCPGSLHILRIKPVCIRQDCAVWVFVKALLN